MTARSVSMGAPFRWLMKSLDVGRKNPRALFGGFAILMAIALVPSVIQMAGGALFPGTPAAVLAIYAFSMLLSLVLMPPLLGSAFVLMHGTERGLPVSAGDITNGFRDLPFATRMWLTTLLFMLVYVVVFGLLFVLMPGKEFMVELFARSAGLAPGEQPDMAGMPSFPPSFLLWMMFAALVILVLTCAYMLAYARAALNGRSAVAATVDGFLGTLRNILPFLAIGIVVTIVGFIALMIFAVIAGLAIALLSAVSPVLAFAIGVPIYLGLMLMIYVIMYGFFYHAWNEIFDEPAVAREDEIAV